MEENKHFIWAEQYRPKTLDDLIVPADVKQQFRSYIEQKQIPNLLMTSTSPGTGKSSAAKALCNELGIKYLFLNASLNNSIDDIRTTVMQYATTMVMFDSPCNHKVVIFDECLDENELIITGTIDNQTLTKLKDIPRDVSIPLVSFNMDTETFDNDFGSIISEKEEDVYEVELDDGRKILMTANHPMIISNLGDVLEKSIDDGLAVGDEVVVYETMKMDTVKIKAITKVGIRKVRNLTVEKNHTFINGDGIVTHNCDRLSGAASDSLKTIIEEVSKNCRFILTANNKHKIIEPLQSRCTNIDFVFNKEESAKLVMQMYKRCCFILDEQKVEYSKPALAGIVKNFAPDNRRLLLFLQNEAACGKIDEGTLAKAASVMPEALVLAMKDKKFKEVSQWIANNADGLQEDFYDKLFKLLEPVLVDQSIPEVVLVLGDYQKFDNVVPSKNIHYLAMCVEVMMSAKFK